MTAPDPDRRSTSSLGRRFWQLWAASAAANLADGLSLVAFPLLAIALTDDARLIALVTVFRFLPFLLIGLPAGVLLDRSDRRSIAIVAQGVRATTVAVVAVNVWRSGGSMPLLVAAAFLVGAGEVLTDGGLPALVRQLVRRDQLEVANGRFAATQTVTNIFVGPPLGAALFELEPAAPFIATVALFVVAGMILARMPGNYRPERSSSTAAEPSTGWRGLVHDISVGLRYVLSHPVLRPLAFAVMAFSFVGQATSAVYVILAVERFGLDGVGFGVLISVRGVTSVVMSFGVAMLVRRTSHSTSMIFAVVTMTIAQLILGFTTVVALAFVAALINGLTDPAWNVVSSTVRQRLVPDEVFGRMMTAYLFIAWSMNPVGALVGGLIAHRWGAQWVSVLAAVVVGSLLVTGRGLFRAVDDAMADAAMPT